MRKQLISVAIVLLLCGLPVLASAQAGGKWKRITDYSNKTGDKTTALSVTSLSSVSERGVEHIATLIIIGGSKPWLMIDFGGQFIYSEYKDMKSEGWFDETKDSPLKVKWFPMMGNTLSPILADNEALLRSMEKAQVFHISFWANDSQRYVHTFPVAGLAAHLGFLGITLKSKSTR